MRPAPDNSTGIYISVPFCRAKCSYCNFASGVFAPQRMKRYVDRLLEEIGSARQRTRKVGAVLPAVADSIYFGGGTPGLLGSNDLGRVVAAVRQALEVSFNAEITLECAPGQITEEPLETLAQIGFNRVSLGVQSFIDREAAAVGRMHTREIVDHDIARLRRAGIESINIDLIAGLPHQTIESWHASIDHAIEVEVPHVSVYMLDVDEDSRLGREIISGGTRYGAPAVPQDATIAAMYGEACERLDRAGIRQYEISNFAQPGWESRHNLKYWRRLPYIGFGLDAHSFLPGTAHGQVRFAATDDLETYLEGAEPVIASPVSGFEGVEEAWFLGLRMVEGVCVEDLEHRFGEGAVAPFEQLLIDHESNGLIYREGNSVRLTPLGRLFANDVFQSFLGARPESMSHRELATQ